MEQREATTGLYDHDFALWIKAQVAALREGRLSAVDIENVAEELAIFAHPLEKFRACLPPEALEPSGSDACVVDGVLTPPWSAVAREGFATRKSRS